MPGKTHSFLDQTPEPYGQDVLPTRSSKSVFQYSVHSIIIIIIIIIMLLLLYNRMILKKASG
jgi:hypothetical protein